MNWSTSTLRTLRSLQIYPKEHSGCGTGAGHGGRGSTDSLLDIFKVGGIGGIIGIIGGWVGGVMGGNIGLVSFEHPWLMINWYC